MYEPLRMFVTIGGCTFSLGLLISLRFLYYYLTGNGAGHIQSLILAAVCFIGGFQAMMLGLIADLNGSNRRLIEDVLYRVRRQELKMIRRRGKRPKQRVIKASPKADHKLRNQPLKLS
jgi:hypothetical protein